MRKLIKQPDEWKCVKRISMLSDEELLETKGRLYFLSGSLVIGSCIVFVLCIVAIKFLA